MAVQQGEAVECAVRIAARPETVFEFFTDPEKHIQWMGRRAELDARPGGTYSVEINEQIVAQGEFTKIEDPSRVVFTFGWEGQVAGGGEHGVPPGSSRVEVSLEPDGDGTLVRLLHFDLPPEARDMHGQGWGLYLARLAVAATGGDPGSDPNASTD